MGPELLAVASGASALVAFFVGVWLARRPFVLRKRPNRRWGERQRRAGVPVNEAEYVYHLAYIDQGRVERLAMPAHLFRDAMAWMARNREDVEPRRG